MPENGILRSLLAAAVVLSVAGEADASVVRAASFDEKVENAAAIVLGKCVRSESAWDESKRWIVTRSTFAVEKSMKGASRQEVTIITPGGSVGDVHQDTVGVPQFAPGDERVLFVKSTPVGETVLYFDQGTYEVSGSGARRRMVAPVASDAVVMDTQRGVAVAREEPATLEQFERAVVESQRRTRQRMEMELLEEREARDQSLSAILLRNRALLALALVGIALATWQFVRRGR